MQTLHTARTNSGSQTIPMTSDTPDAGPSCRRSAKHGPGAPVRGSRGVGRLVGGEDGVGYGDDILDIIT